MTRTLDELLADAASRIRRYTPAEADAAGVTLVDIRSQHSRDRDGVIPGAYHVPLRPPRLRAGRCDTVLEWRLASREWRNTELDGKTVALVCDEGYSSILAAATLVELGRDAGDVIGGFAAWKAAGLPTASVP